MATLYKTDLAGFEDVFFEPKYENGVIVLSADDHAKKLIKRMTGNAVYGNLTPISGTPASHKTLVTDILTSKEKNA
jgi:hypothetical protein